MSSACQALRLGGVRGTDAGILTLTASRLLPLTVWVLRVNPNCFALPPSILLMALTTVSIAACVVTSPKPQAYEQALEYLRCAPLRRIMIMYWRALRLFPSLLSPRGTCVAVGLPPTGAKVQADVFFTVLCQKSLKGSYVGNRLDTMEALQIAADGYVKSSLVVQPMSKIHECFERMEKGTLAGRVGECTCPCSTLTLWCAEHVLTDSLYDSLAQSWTVRF